MVAAAKALDELPEPNSDSGSAGIYNPLAAPRVVTGSHSRPIKKQGIQTPSDTEARLRPRSPDAAAAKTINSYQE